MRKLPDNYIDLIVTDPPYGYSFMGKDWDKVVIPASHWKECLRVLKPGAFAFIMSAPRQDVLSRVIVNLQDAGFEIEFSSIYWTMASGFPKASNVGKMVDKRLGIKMPIGKRFTTAGKGNEKMGDPTPIGKERDKMRHKATSPQAKELDGSYSGFQPKPAVEIIIVAMKPLSEKTYVDQALKNGHGITWLDDCRIPHKEPLKETNRKKDMGQSWNKKNCGLRSNPTNIASASPKGRFPANLLVSGDVLNDGKERKSGLMKQHIKGGKFNVYGKMYPRNVETIGDKGSYSRFFDLDKWWEERIKKLPESVRKVFPFLMVPKASKREKNRGCEKIAKTRKCRWNNAGEWKNLKTKQYGNIHPTCKPIKLMSYLITLGSRENNIILDPFAGSGTTLIASKILNRKGIGIELSKEYCEIAKHRIKGNQ